MIVKMESEKNEIKYGLGISFKIDAPKSFTESVFNSIILGLSEYKNRENEDWNCDLDTKIKVQNDLLMRLQSEIEQLIVKVEE